MDKFTQWIAIARLAPDVDVDGLSLLLNQQGVEHQLRPDNDALVLFIGHENKRFAAQAIAQSFMHKASHKNQPNLKLPSSLPQMFRELPIVLICIVLSIGGALLVSFKFEWIHLLTYVNFQIHGDKIFFIPFEHSLHKREYWRLITPAFLHFGMFHVVFNCLWLWELGRRIEKLTGSLHMLAVVFICALVANIAQYHFEGPSLFGGMSGVVYGLLGYIWLRNRIAPHPFLVVAPGLLVLMVGWLLICTTGFVDLFISGGVANAAHIGGLLAGILLGICFGVLNAKKSVV